MTNSPKTSKIKENIDQTVKLLQTLKKAINFYMHF